MKGVGDEALVISATPEGLFLIRGVLQNYCNAGIGFRID